MRYVTLIFCLVVQPLSAQTFLQNGKKTEPLNIHFSPPEGFSRVKLPPGSFGAWLRKMPILKKRGPVRDYRGRIFKTREDSAVAAVAACDISGRSLDQCMDILMRFYSAWLKENGRLDALALALPDGTMLGFSDWKKGIRPFFKGLHFQLKQTARIQKTNILNAYLNTIFEWTGTQAFYHFYKTVPLDSLQPGDFIIKKGRKGHAVLIADLVSDAQGNKLALIGQGDTPACAFYFLQNSAESPWIRVSPESAFPRLPIRKKMYWTGLRRFAP